MSVTEIPARYRYSCSGCLAIEEMTTKSRPKYWSDLHILRDAYDWSGNACADGSVKLMLCLKCSEAATAAINKALDERRGQSETSALEARRGETGTGSTAEGSDIATAESRDAQNPEKSDV